MANGERLTVNGEQPRKRNVREGWSAKCEFGRSCKLRRRRAEGQKGRKKYKN